MLPDRVISQLQLCDVSLMVHLGCSEVERELPQEVCFSIDFDIFALLKLTK